MTISFEASYPAAWLFSSEACAAKTIRAGTTPDKRAHTHRTQRVLRDSTE
jgi:hypothetical protein